MILNCKTGRWVQLSVLLYAYWELTGGVNMKKFRTVVSLIIMIIAGIVGIFIGAAMNEGLNGAILFSMIAGISCIIYMIDNKED